MKKYKRCFWHTCFGTCAILVLYPATAISQPNSDSIVLQKATESYIDGYKHWVNENLRLFNGIQYSFVSKQFYGFPFWKTDSLINGSICYDGNRYDNIPLKYDCTNQNVVTVNYDRSNQIILINDKVQEFNIYNHHFFKLRIKKGNEENETAGFYDRIYAGKIIVWASRNKELKRFLNGEEEKNRFIEYDAFYVQKENVFSQVKDKKDLLEILKDGRNKITDFIKENKLKLSDDFEAALIKVATYYDQLKN